MKSVIPFLAVLFSLAFALTNLAFALALVLFTFALAALWFCRPCQAIHSLDCFACTRPQNTCAE